MKTAGGPLLALLLMLAASLTGAVPAQAHSALLASVPEDGATVSVAPARFVLSFNEDVSPLVLSLVRPDGTRTALERIEIREKSLDVRAPVDLAEGTHVLSWRVVSADGHPMAGTVTFSIGKPSATPPSVDDAADRILRAGTIAARLALYAGLFAGIGGAFAFAWLARYRRDGATVVVAALFVGIAGAILSVGLQGLDALGAPIQRLTEAEFWSAGLRTTFSRTSFAGVFAMVLGLISMQSDGATARLLSLMALIGGGISLSLSGHAAAAEPQWLMRPAVFLHTLGVAFWVGALIPLACALRSGEEGTAAMLGRFSRSIPWVLLGLVLAGIALTIVQVEQASALFETDYGWLLLAKLIVVAALLGLAALNRWRLTADIQKGLSAPRRQMVRFISLEVACVVLILGAVAGWRFTPPPRALSIAASQPVSVTMHTLRALVDLTLSPGRKGPLKATITALTGEYGPLDAAAMRLTLAPPGGSSASIQRDAERRPDGTWVIDRIDLPLAGQWTVELEIRPKGQEPIQLESTLKIRP